MNDKLKIIAGVVGDPISHSVSPRLHGYWLKKYNINGEYKAFHVKPEGLDKFIKTLASNNISGVNLTVPHKENALELVDIVDDAAQKIGAINTVYRNENKQLVGSNTDGYGFLKNLKQGTNDWHADHGPVALIGSGGAARAIIDSLLNDGVPEIRLCNRTKARAEKLALEVNDPRLTVYDWKDREGALKNAALLVNVTTLGMTGQPELDLSLDHLPVTAVVYDIVYNPLQTNLLKAAKERGNITVDGLGMLLHQAVPGFKAWFGVLPEVDDQLRDHVLEALR
ncbi:MAG: shikimate dehydrogenase [Kordiimonadaceae bacterium]|jgi:shikimate dehydrogenase|nr:shikimate dehydrogenase [Kordiimonadaceae bacterium]MBT6033319.1 shikimate dehydrogenase [Kordiimonadaceae bacterium]